MQNKKYLKSGLARTCFKGGFTLLEILLVVGIIAILAGIVIVAINPGKQIAMARNTERKSDLKQINSALQQYYIDHREYPDGISDELTDICDTGSTASSSVESELGAGYCDEFIDLSVLVPTYITAIPRDPQISISSGSSGYQVIRHSSGKVGLKAPSAESGQTVTVNIPPEETVTNTCWSGTPSVGMVCSGEAVYAGEFNGIKYMKTATTSLGVYVWGPMDIEVLYPEENYLNSGYDNYGDYLASLGADYAAATYCSNLTEGGYDNWYLPDHIEAQYIWTDDAELAVAPGQWSPAAFWTSTESSDGTAIPSLGYNNPAPTIEKNTELPVRCIRKY
jgi:prepilin-type N-terminal cleavage/methylation domain-containing protein